MSLSSQYYISLQSASTMVSTDYEKAIAIAISLLKHRNSQTVQMLKDLLTFIPNPNHAKSVLTTAIIRLIYTCPQSTLWLFQHPDVVEPQIKVRELIAQELTGKLLSWGFPLKDFWFTTDYYLEMSEDAKQLLLSAQIPSGDESVLTLARSLLMQ